MTLRSVMISFRIGISKVIVTHEYNIKKSPRPIHDSKND